MLSNEVASEIRMTQGDEAEETARFAEYFDKFFDCLNVSNHVVGKHSKNTFKNPYRKPKTRTEDFRLEVSCEIFNASLFIVPIVARKGLHAIPT